MDAEKLRRVRAEAERYGEHPGNRDRVNVFPAATVLTLLEMLDAERAENERLRAALIASERARVEDFAEMLVDFHPNATEAEKRVLEQRARERRGGGA